MKTGDRVRISLEVADISDGEFLYDAMKSMPFEIEFTFKGATHDDKSNLFHIEGCIGSLEEDDEE